MSAPPIGMMMRKPSASDSSAISQKMNWLPVVTKPMISSSSRMPSPRLIGCWFGKTIGAPFMIACSLAKAMSEPVKVTAPMARPIDISIRLWVWMLPCVPIPNASGAFSAAAATKTAARPTSEWNAATSCGSAVIWMRLATTVPIEPPIAMPTRISTTVPKPMPAWNSVANTAISMPIMPNWLPRFEVAGCDRPRSAKMNRIAAIR